MTDRRHNRFSAVTGWMTGLLLLAGACVHADTDENGYAVLIEQSPIYAGTVNPGLGVHKMGIGSTVTLTAIPRPGYRFLYWLGDVSNPASMATQVRVDAPKIVIAVYERDEFELPLPATEVGLPAGAPHGGARYNPTSIGGDGSMMAFYPQYDYPVNFPDQPDPDINDPFPVPGEVDKDFPVPGDNPIPEPTTWCLLAAGAVLLRLQRRFRINSCGEGYTNL